MSNRKTNQNQKNPSHQEMNTLMTMFTQGRYLEAENLGRMLTKRFPRSGVCWTALGAVLKQRGRDVDALAAMRKAAALMPNVPEVHYNLGVTHSDLGQLDDAEASYRRALQIRPDLTDAHNNLGLILYDLGRLDEAEASYRRALAINPEFVEAHSHLGLTLHDLGRLDEAEACYRRALAINPAFVEAHCELGLTLYGLGRLDEAEVSLRYALQIKPDYAEAHNNLGNILKELSRLDEAEACYRRALAINPAFVEAHKNLGLALHDLGRLDEAEGSFRRALAINPDYAEAHYNLGNVLMTGLSRFDEAVASFGRAIEIRPDYAEAHGNLGNALKDLGRFDDAVASYRRAREISPDSALHFSNILFCLSHQRVDAKDLLGEHIRFGERFEAPLRDNWPRHTNVPDPERCLQIGFVSGDFRYHAMANFIEPLLAQLSGRPKMALHAYYSHAIEDDVTRRLRGYFAYWHAIAKLSDAALAERIREDGIDILIDLSGHTSDNRLLAFARKPAPVQASWMGYPGTTGLRAMDYYLADRLFLASGQFDDQFTEKIVRLPANAPFLPSSEAPPVSALPASSNGYVTFCSFNHPSKLSPQVIALWSQLLRALPESRMLLGGMHEGEGHEALIDWFAREGIAGERLQFHGRCGMGRYLELHHQVDICLDTFPYNGATTTLHALWMGVPTLSLIGTTAAGRTGAAILGHVGLQDFITHDAAEFLVKGLSWAGRLTELADIRTGLRGRVARSAISRPALIAAGLERALRIMWQRWCEGLPAESFEVGEQELNDPALEGGQ
jgi:protein O-GlcNAc transferase